jgi:hypothetical protein
MGKSSVLKHRGIEIFSKNDSSLAQEFHLSRIASDSVSSHSNGSKRELDFRAGARCWVFRHVAWNSYFACVITGRRMPNGSKVGDIADSIRRFDVTTSIGQIRIQ